MDPRHHLALIAIVLIAILAAASCSSSDDSSSASSSTAEPTTAPPTSPGPATAVPTTPVPATAVPATPVPSGAACTPAAVDPVVRAALGSAGSPEIAEVQLSECAGGYARAFAIPVEATFESEQLFLVDIGGTWTILDYGTGLDCADSDLTEGLEAACVALGLR